MWPEIRKIAPEWSKGCGAFWRSKALGRFPRIPRRLIHALGGEKTIASARMLPNGAYCRGSQSVSGVVRSLECIRCSESPAVIFGIERWPLLTGSGELVCALVRHGDKRATFGRTQPKIRTRFICWVTLTGIGPKLAEFGQASAVPSVQSQPKLWVWREILPRGVSAPRETSAAARWRSPRPPPAPVAASSRAPRTPTRRWRCRRAQQAQGSTTAGRASPPAPAAATRI